MERFEPTFLLSDQSSLIFILMNFSSLRSIDDGHGCMKRYTILRSVYIVVDLSVLLSF
jgi:hypothetical protein